jgi:hypothetical protein
VLYFSKSIDIVVKITYFIYSVGDEGQKARKTKQEAFPTLETVFTKLQLLSYFDQHQVTSQVTIDGMVPVSLRIFFMWCIFRFN